MSKSTIEMKNNKKQTKKQRDNAKNANLIKL